MFIIPSGIDLECMRTLPAGESEDQYARLTHMANYLQTYQKTHPELQLYKTENVEFSDPWLKIFSAIKDGKTESALSIFHRLPNNDLLRRLLLAAHSEEYIDSIIIACALANPSIEISGDVVVTKPLFEALVSDLVAAITNNEKLQFSFGLPTHHAYTDNAAGFCIFNKTAMLVAHEYSKDPNVICVVLGTDINRDDGLSEILMQNCWRNVQLRHLDVFDSRVYPWHDFNYITQLYGRPIAVEKSNQTWAKNNRTYCAVDISLCTRGKKKVHPAINLLITQINTALAEARRTNKKIALFLPSGWDSHVYETAACGKVLNKRTYLSTKNAPNVRFTDSDFRYFYEYLLNVCESNQDYISSVYWGLEGGYNTNMYLKQMELLLDVLNKKDWLAPSDDMDVEIIL